MVGYDLDYRPTTRVDAATSNVPKLTYGYYANNSVNTITDAVNASNSQTMNYDALDRLTSATSGTGGYGTYTLSFPLAIISAGLIASIVFFLSLFLIANVLGT